MLMLWMESESLLINLLLFYVSNLRFLFVSVFIEIPSITKDPEDTIGLEGDDATLCCEAKGTPTPEYTWYVSYAV